jgi:hypothetical protein
MNNQNLQIAAQAGLQQRIDNPNEIWGYRADLERFAKLVRQDERKSCANILDAFAEDMENKEWTMGAAAMRGAADTIRFKQTNDETEGQK